MAVATDKRKNQKKRKTQIEYAKTALIAVLFMAMTVLAFFEIVLTQQINRPEPNIDIESLLVLYDDRPQSTIDPYILPEFLGYSIGGVSRGLFGSETTMRGIYGALKDLMAELLTGGVCRTLNSSEADETWTGAREGDFIYVSYFEELPASVIAYAVSDGETELAEGDIPYIRELLFTPYRSGEADSWRLVTRSSEGAVSIYTPKEGEEPPVFDDSAVTAYNNSRQLGQFEFLGLVPEIIAASGTKIDENTGDGAKTSKNAIDGSLAVYDDEAADVLNLMHDLSPVQGIARLFGLRDTTVLIDGEFSQKDISVETGPELTGRILESNAAEELLGLLGINTERVAPYRSQGYTIYLGESGRVRFSDAGGIDYTAVSSGNKAGSGGVPVSSFLGYENYGGRYTFFELLNAAASLLEKLKVISPDLLGGEAYPGLVSVSAGDAGLELVFGYYYDNYRIIGLGSAITMTFSGGALTRLAITPARVVKSGARVSLPQNLAIMHLCRESLAADAQPAELSVLTMAYNVEQAARIYNEGSGTSASGGNAADTTSVETVAADSDETTGEGETEADEETAPIEPEVRDPSELNFSPEWMIVVERKGK